MCCREADVIRHARGGDDPRTYGFGFAGKSDATNVPERETSKLVTERQKKQREREKSLENRG